MKKKGNIKRILLNCFVLKIYIKIKEFKSFKFLVVSDYNKLQQILSLTLALNWKYASMYSISERPAMLVFF